MNNTDQPSPMFIEHMEHQFKISPKKAEEIASRMNHEFKKRGISWQWLVNTIGHGSELGLLTLVQRIWNQITTPKAPGRVMEKYPFSQPTRQAPSPQQPQKSPQRQHIEDLLNNFSNVGYFDQNNINNNDR